YWTGASRTAGAIVAEMLSEVPGIRVDRAFRSPTQLRDAYGEFDLVIATRMHAAILSLCAGTPVVPVAYEFKTRELFDGLGMGELVDDIDALSAESLTARVNTALDEADTLRGDMSRLPPGLRQRAAEPSHRSRRIVAAA